MYGQNLGGRPDAKWNSANWKETVRYRPNKRFSINTRSENTSEKVWKCLEFQFLTNDFLCTILCSGGYTSLFFSNV